MTGALYLKKKRSEHGLSLRRLEALAGVSYVQIKNIEEGKNVPSFDTTLKLTYALGIPMDDYLNAIGYKEPVRGEVVGCQGFEPRQVA